MVELPPSVMAVMNDPKAIKVISTKEPEGCTIHTVQMGSMVAFNPRLIVFGRILTKRTHRNLEEMMRKDELPSISINREHESYEIRARIRDYQTSGELLDRLNKGLESYGLKAFGAWALEPVEVWNECASAEAGTRMA